MLHIHDDVLLADSYIMCVLLYYCFIVYDRTAQQGKEVRFLCGLSYLIKSLYWIRIILLITYYSMLSNLCTRLPSMHALRLISLIILCILLIYPAI